MLVRILLGTGLLGGATVGYVPTEATSNKSNKVSKSYIWFKFRRF